ncbi:MAG: hypothetical protein WA843_00745 [Candidatus Saccharimonadales bacterium]
MERRAAIKYNPDRLDRISGLLGRFGVWSSGGVGLSAHRSREGERHTLHELLDHYETNDQGSDLAPESAEATALLGLLKSGAQLEKPLFLPDLKEVDKRRVCAIKASFSEWTWLPVRNFVLAPGLEDWNQGRDGTKFDPQSGRSRGSRQIIRNYARRGTPMPAIDLVSANVQPNGTVLYRVVRDGAHRVAAAHLRGDEEIAVANTIHINRLSENLVPDQA